MKQSEKHTWRSAFPRPVRLYREQVQDIIDTLKHAELEVTISDGDFTFSDLDDLKENRGTRITDLTITGRTPEKLSMDQVSIMFARSQCPHLFLAGGNQDRLATCWYRLRDIITESYRWHQKALSPLVGWCLLCSFFVGGAVVMEMAPAWGQRLYLPSFGVVTVYLLVAIYWHRTYAVILLDRQHEVSSFWKRNSDKIILIVVSAVLGALIALGVEALLGG